MFNKSTNVVEMFSANDAVAAAVNPEMGLSRKEKLQVAGIASAAALAVNVSVRLVGKGVSALHAKHAAKKAAEKPAA